MEFDPKLVELMVLRVIIELWSLCQQSNEPSDYSACDGNVTAGLAFSVRLLNRPFRKAMFCSYFIVCSKFDELIVESSINYLL